MDDYSSFEKHDESLEELEVLKAEIVYVVLKKSCYVSRSLRLQWFLQHVNTKIRIEERWRSNDEETDSETTVVSIIPQETFKNWTIENAHTYEYFVEFSTNVVFIGEVYRQVYCLDISPSVSTVDIQHGEVLLDTIIKALRKSIKFLVKPFVIPGSSHLFIPDIFITVIAHTPFYILPAQQVLVQGWKITEKNVDEFLGAVQRQLKFIEDAVAKVSGNIHEQFERERKKSLVEQIELKKSTEALFNDSQEMSFTPTSPNIAMVSPGSGFLNLLRYGMLALKLLPISNFSNLVVITDGMVIMPDIDTLDSVLNHMRYNDIACYFLHVGSQFHPHCGFGFVPYSEVMQLISIATNGTYLQFPPSHKLVGGLNVYQYHFLTWSVKRKSIISDLSTPLPKENEWSISNRHFYGNRSPQLLVKKYLESDINVTFYGVLACRIREGFILKDISTRENELVINFILPWTNHIYIEYTLSCQWPMVTTPSISTHYTMNIRAPYEFLHDISCQMKVPIKSPFRQALIARFWRSLKSFAQSDLLLSHLESFMSNVSSYYLPEILKNGMPLYHLTTGSCQPTVGVSEVGFSQFSSIWRPACLLNNNLWQKWFHADRVGVIFKHDEPLNLFPRSLQTTNIQNTGMLCRQATNTLLNFLKSNSSFMLIENHSFIKFLSPNESGTGKQSFFVVRSILKPPYAVLHIAFLHNIPGRVRWKVLKDFKAAINDLKIPRQTMQKDSFEIVYGSEKTNLISNTYNSQTNCCILLDKPLEKILIRYEQMPKEFKTVVFPDGTQPSAKTANAQAAGRGLITTLSRYLHHRRWIWQASAARSVFLPSSALAIVLSTLVKIRLQEGFYFAHFSPGICNMVLEVQMKGAGIRNNKSNDSELETAEEEVPDEPQSCIIQYVLFSPKTFKMDKDADDGNANNVKVVELVNECWIEPQHGVITGCPPIRNYMSNLQYHQLPDALWSVDAKCISALFTFEYLRLMSENPNYDMPESIQSLLKQPKTSEYWPNVAPFEDQRISQMPFAFSVPNLLCQCVQEILQFNLFSIDVTSKCDVNTESNKLLLESIYNHLSTVNDKELVFSGEDAQYFIKNFRKNFRRSFEKRHNSSCGLFQSSDSRRSSRTSDDNYGVLPTPHDWDRMIAWALGAAESGSKRSLAVQRSHADAKRRRCPSTEVVDNGSLNSSNFDVSSITNLADVDWLKWRCYVRFASKTLCLLTVVPDNLDVVRRLTVDHRAAAAAGEPSDSTYYDVDGEDGNCSTPGAKNDSSLYASCRELNDDESTTDQSSSTTTTAATTPTNANFRLRASTWDPVRRSNLDASHATADDRLRTNSVGARMKPLPRLRPKRSSDYDSRERLAAFNDSSQAQNAFVSLALPVYVCKCSLTEVINYLISKNECAQCEDDSQSSIGNEHLAEQCHNMSEVFTKFFLLSLFKCLQQGFAMPVMDIDLAFGKCETSVITIDITDYLKVVCKHLKCDSSSQNGTEKKDVKSSPSCFMMPGVCCELRPIHRLIKKKFVDILTLDFRSIPTKPEFYYFFPSWTKESKPSSVGMLSPRFTEPTISVEQIIPTPGSILGMAWETCKESVTSDDNACTSLLSNMDSDSLNETTHESLLDELNPLFLKLVCNVFTENGVVGCPVSEIPTCISEILGQQDKSIDADSADLRITMDLICLTSPYSDAKKKTNGDCADDATKATATFTVEDTTCETNADDGSFTEGKVPKQVAQLPDYQYNALNSCIAQMKWLMKDEIISFMLDTSTVTADTLKMVCDHIETSPTAATCFLENVSLSFVYGKEATSIENFLQDFDNIRIPNYRLKKEDNMYYLTKDGEKQISTSFSRREFDEQDYPAIEIGKLRTSSMDIVNEEQENYFHVFSSSEDSIFESEQTRSTHSDRNDGDDDSSRTLQSTINWILERQYSNTELPNFWLIMTIVEDYVNVYFHCRFLDIKRKEIEEYVRVRETVIGNIKNVCKTVNQKMLLKSLHDTRICDQLLIPDQQDDDDDGPPSSVLEANHAFVPGCFACDVVWETKFILHPRLKISPLKGAVSRGVQALCSFLSKFSVTNRKNLFVYQDVDRNVFYLRLYESTHLSRSQESEETSSTGSFSRSSSFNSLSRKQFDEQLPFLLDDSKSRNKSFSDAGDSMVLRNDEYITLKVHGIVDAGNDIKTDLVHVLQNKLDDAVLDVISVMLSRNSLCKLLSEDVHFIQKPNQLPNFVIQFHIPQWTTKYLYSFRYLIKQNMQTLACSPRYSEPRASFHFQDYSVPEDSPRRIGESDIFLYNQPQSVGKGVACLAYTIVNEFGDCIEGDDEGETCPKYVPAELPQVEALQSSTEARIADGRDANYDYPRVEFRVWKQGKVNRQVLESKLCAAIRYALWELITEKYLLMYPLFVPCSDELCEVHHTCMPKWIHFGTELGVPSARFWETSVPVRSNLSIIARELNAALLPHDVSCFAFYKQANVIGSEQAPYKPCGRFDEIMQTEDACAIVGRHLTAMQELGDYMKNIHFETNKKKGLQRLPSVSQEDPPMMIAKKKFLFITIANSKLRIHIYNWKKDKFEGLIKVVTGLSDWLQARAHLLYNIVEQKMGIFHYSLIQRPDQSKKVQELLNSNVDVFLKYPIAHKSSSSGLPMSKVHDAFKNVKLARAIREKLTDANPFAQNVNHLIEIQNVEFQSQYKPLQNLWQTKAPSSNTSLSEEMLQNFLTHGRLIHYCLTPLLFMPSWRVDAASTRDHSLSLRTLSQEELAANSDDEKWHSMMCSNFVNEYKHYLQAMGFSPINRQNEDGKHNGDDNKETLYMQKYLLGGVLLYELYFAKPFFNAKLYALEYSRLSTKTNSLLSQFMVSFLDECDRIKFQMHLHSFTYDYHLRCLHQFILDQQPLLRHGYHMVDFLDDFMKYYPKAPNYARSLVHTEIVTVEDVSIQTSSLFNYLLAHSKDYDMDAFCMTSQCSSGDFFEENEYALIKKKITSAVVYKDANDINQTEDFDIVAIISHLKDTQDEIIKFQIYILINCRRELYPKMETEQKLGKFRTVSTSYDYSSSNEDDIDGRFSIYGESSSSNQSQEFRERRKKTPHHIEIKQEFVNYLGYYSSHEEAMQNMMLDEVEEAKKFLSWIVEQGTFDCKTHTLWNKLLRSAPNPLTYQELQQLINLADVYEISSMDSQLRNVLNQPITWLQSFVKALVAKLPESCHLFPSQCGNTQELLILHPQFLNGFVLMILNMQTNTCSMNMVFRRGTYKEENGESELMTLFEQIVNTYCFHLWLDAF